MRKMKEETGVTLYRKAKSRVRAAAFFAFEACALSCVLAVCIVMPAHAAGSSAETEIGVVFIEEPQVDEQGDDPVNPGPSQEGQQNQTNLPQKDASDGLLADDQGGSYWLQTTGDAVGKASGVLALIAAVAAFACLIAARRIGKEGRHVR